MRVLFSTGTSALHLAPPVLSHDQINCGPDWADESEFDGRVMSLTTPAGEYDLAAVAARLPADQQPDVVVCLIDSGWRNIPRNLAAFGCPKVAFIADTHHLKSPLISTMRYLATETFDRIVFLHDRHHIRFFRAAGFQNLFWLPGLTFPHADSAVRAARQATRDVHLAAVGQTSAHHPRSSRLLGGLAARGVPVVARALAPNQALGHFGASLLGFNASLNGELNPRVFEILAAGAGLITDQLAPESGLASLFVEGREVVTYGSPTELAERVTHYLSRPEEAQALGAAGISWFDTHFNAKRRREVFRGLVFDGVVPPEFAISSAESAQVFYGGDQASFVKSLVVYEGVQELHRTQETVRVVLDDVNVPADFGEICATLPRVELPPPSAAAGADLGVFSGGRLDDFPLHAVKRLWCWDTAPEDSKEFEELLRQVTAAGFKLSSRDMSIFSRVEKTGQGSSAGATTPPIEYLAQARALFRQGNLNAACILGRASLEQHPWEARVLLGELALMRADADQAEKFFLQALEMQPSNDGVVEALLAEAWCAQHKLSAADEILGGLLKKFPHHLHGSLAFARLRLAQQQATAAEAILRGSVLRHPASTLAARALGDLLKRKGSIAEALGWHRRALRENAPVPLVDPKERVVHVAFLVQHPQEWTSVHSVWAAFVEDPAFFTTVIAAPYQHPLSPEGGPEAIFGFLEAQRIPFVRWEAFDFAPHFADVLFVPNPYDLTRPPALRTPELLKKVPRLAYVPCGLEIGGGAENIQDHFNRPLQQMAWAIFARSTRHKAMFARHCAMSDAHVTVTGHPRLDAMRRLGETSLDSELLALRESGRKVVVWNPHFDLRPDGTGYSTFLDWQAFFIETFARREDLALVIRPHPLFFGTLEKRQIWSAADISDFHQRVKAAGNIFLDRRASYLPALAVSSALISDASTFLLEYAGTDKSLLYLHNSRGPQLMADGDFIRAHAHMAEQRADVMAFLEVVSAGEDSRVKARQTAYPAVMSAPAGGVGQAIKQAVRQRLLDETCVREPAALTAG